MGSSKKPSTDWTRYEKAWHPLRGGRVNVDQNPNFAIHCLNTAANSALHRSQFGASPFIISE
jgi:hypothetical protein